VDPGEAIVDPDTPGTGVCSNETAGTILAAIWQIWPELADITVIYDSNAGLIGDGSFVHIFQSGDGFRLVLVRGSGDCPAGCIDHEYWYFETDASCDPTQVGHYSRIFDSSGNCYRIEGNALWGLPEPSDAGRCPDVDLSALNTECADGTCPAGLTPVSFYGIAGEAGPLFCWCTIVCADNPSACPSGTTCQMIADGPGLVCYA
jgi:hypothetical protein